METKKPGRPAGSKTTKPRKTPKAKVSTRKKKPATAHPPKPISAEKTEETPKPAKKVNISKKIAKPKARKKPLTPRKGSVNGSGADTIPAGDVSRALDLRLNHRLTYEEIGKVLGVTRQSIHKKIRHLIPTEQTKEFVTNRAEIIAHQQLRLLSAGLTDAKLKKISSRDAVVSMGILYDKERLERGQATSITDIRTLVLELDAAEARAIGMLPNGPQKIVDITPPA